MRFATPAAALGAALIFTAPALADTLTFTTSAPPTAPQSDVFEDWAAMLAEKTDGELEVEFYYQQSLSKLADNLEAIASGLADIGIVVAAYDRAKMPLTYLSSTSFGTGDPYVVSRAWLDAREEFPSIAAEDEANDVKFLTAHSINSTIMVGDKFYRTPEDMEGETMRLSSHWVYAAKTQDIGVNPARIRSPETYTSLEKGTISGAVSYPGQLYPYKLNEVADHVTVLDLGQHMNMYYINRDRWEDMDAAHRQLIEESLPQLTLDLAKAEIDYDEDSFDRVQKDPDYPMQLHRLTEDERAKWQEALAPSYEKNVEDAASVNPAATEIGDFYTSRIDEVQQTVKSEGYPWE